MAKKLVKFYQGPEANYISGYTEGKYQNGIFFATDTFTIWKDGNLYGNATDEITKDWVDEKFGGAFCEIIESADGYVFSFVDVNGNANYSISIPEANANKSGVMSASDYSKLAGIDAENIVYKEAGKGLSTNDYTNEDKEKLEGIESGAQINKLETVKVDGVALTNIEKSVDIRISDIIKDQVGDKVSTAYIYKGSVNTEEELPKEGNNIGDVYNIIVESAYGSAGVNVAWNGSEWDSLGGIFNTSNIDIQIQELGSQISGVSDRVATLEDLDISKRLNDIENTIDIFNSDVEIEGSIANTARDVAQSVIEEALAWEEI